MNFVKTKLRLDKMPEGALLEVWLDSGEPIESVYSSMKAEGHEVAEPESMPGGAFSLSIRKVCPPNI